jgi:hypothetical protein
MSITKVLNGRRILALIFCSTSFLLLNISCRQINNFPEAYTIIFRNEYFEELDYVEINGQKMENIAVNEYRVIENINCGNYKITIVTRSQLEMESAVSLTGSKSTVKVIINSTGKILLEEIL